MESHNRIRSITASLSCTRDRDVYLLGTARKQRKATYATEGRLEFTRNRLTFWAWLTAIAYAVYFVYVTAIRFKYGHWNVLGVIGASGLVIVLVWMVAEFPGTIVVSPDGLEQIYWLWSNKQIRWDEIEEINAGKKSRTVTITSSSGTMIVHSHLLPDRARLLLELKQHCGENLPPDFPREPISDTDS